MKFLLILLLTKQSVVIVRRRLRRYRSSERQTAFAGALRWCPRDLFFIKHSITEVAPHKRDNVFCTISRRIQVISHTPGCPSGSIFFSCVLHDHSKYFFATIYKKNKRTQPCFTCGGTCSTLSHPRWCLAAEWCFLMNALVFSGSWDRNIIFQPAIAASESKYFEKCDSLPPSVGSTIAI